jgi:hypothetical protein
MPTPAAPYQPKDTFVTLRYQSGLIQTCRNLVTKREEIRILLPDGVWKDARSMAGARRMITRHIGIKPYRGYKATPV